VIHSALISVTVTNFFKSTLRKNVRFYRLFFNTFSIVALVPLLMYSYSAGWKTEPIITWRGGMIIIQYGLIALSAILVLAGARHYCLFQFLGIRQILHGGYGAAMTDTGEFDSSGVLGIVRHPWYVAVFIFLWAHDLNLARITVNMILSAYLVIGTFLEERKLILEFGDKYRLYQRQVSMFIPLKWLKSRYHI
jgi:methanethiol S-methyltransferase